MTWERIKHSSKELLILIKRPEMMILPGHLAFYMVLSLVPMLLIVILLVSIFSLSLDSFLGVLNVSLPDRVNNVLTPLITNGKWDININLLLIFTVYIASSGLYSVIVAANTLYHNKLKNVLIRKIKAIFLTIFFVMMFLFMIVVMAFGNSIVNYIGTTIDNDLIMSYVNNIYFIIKWPFAFLYILFVVNLIYTLAPDNHIKGKSVILGSLFTTITWIILTLGFSYWVDNFTRYDLIYGSLSAFIVMMIWIYFLSYLFILGLAINVNSYRRKIARSEKHEKDDKKL